MYMPCQIYHHRTVFSYQQRLASLICYTKLFMLFTSKHEETRDASAHRQYHRWTWPINQEKKAKETTNNYSRKQRKQITVVPIVAPSVHKQSLVCKAMLLRIEMIIKTICITVLYSFTLLTLICGQPAQDYDYDSEEKMPSGENSYFPFDCCSTLAMRFQSHSSSHVGHNQ
jgi:hypothetical protein